MKTNQDIIKSLETFVQKFHRLTSDKQSLMKTLFGHTLTDLIKISDHVSTALTTEINITWSYEDVKAICPDLNEEQISLVLNKLKRNHDANIGINWDVIQIVADDEFSLQS